MNLPGRMDDLRELVLAGVPKMLARFHQHGVILGLLTGNVREIAFLKLEAAGLGEYFEFGGFGEESEVRSHLTAGSRSDMRRVRSGTVLRVGPWSSETLHWTLRRVGRTVR